MTDKRASDLAVGDGLLLHVYGEVIAITPVGGKQIKVKLTLRGPRNGPRFTEAGRELELLCRSGTDAVKTGGTHEQSVQ